MRRPRLLAGIALALSSSVAPGTTTVNTTTAAPTAAVSAPAWEAGVAALLEERSRAVEAGDLASFLATMRGAPRAFLSRQRAWFERLQRLPLASYSVALEPQGFGDLAHALRTRPAADEVRVVHATIRSALAGFDDVASAQDAFLTLVRRGARWSVVSDDDLDDLGLRSPRELWDFGAVTSARRGAFLALSHPADAPEARRLLPAIERNAARVARAWPPGWRPRGVVVVPGSTAGLERMLQTTFDLGPFVGFATATAHHADAYRFGGFRFYVQPATFFAEPPAFRDRAVGHEMLHLAAFESTGAHIPAWLDEGVAQLYGETSRRGESELRALVHAGRWDRRLPEDHEFAVGGSAAIRAAYQAAASFVRWLDRREGAGAAARLYRALGGKSAFAPGTWRYHLDRAARGTTGEAFEALERSWSAEVVRTLR